MGILRWEAPGHWGWSILRILARASGPADRSTGPIRGTYRTWYSTAFPRFLFTLLTCYLYACVYVWMPHHYKIPYWSYTGTGKQQLGDNTIQPTREPIRSGPELLCRECLLRSASFLHALIQPTVYMDLLLSPLPLIVIIISPLPLLYSLAPEGRFVIRVLAKVTSYRTAVLCPRCFLIFPPRNSQ